MTYERWKGARDVDPAEATLPKDDRRRLVAYFLALPPRLRPTLEATAAYLGVSADTVERDAGRDDVQGMAREAGGAGLSVLVAQAVGGTLAALCLRSVGGEVSAARELRGWANDLGLLAAMRESGGGTVDPGALLAGGLGAPDVGGVLASAEGLRELAALQAARRGAPTGAEEGPPDDDGAE